MQLLRNLKTHIPLLGSQAEATVFMNTKPCSSCLQYVHALKEYTGLRFDNKEMYGIGPIDRSKIGRNNAAVDVVLEEFKDLDDMPDPSDDENEIPSDAVVRSSVPQTLSISPVRTNNAQGPIVIDDDSMDEEQEEASGSWDPATVQVEQTTILAYPVAPGAEVHHQYPMPESLSTTRSAVPEGRSLHTPLAYPVTLGYLNRALIDPRPQRPPRANHWLLRGDWSQFSLRRNLSLPLRLFRP